MYTFFLAGKDKGKTLVINNRYPFTDGVLTVSTEDGEKMKKVLCRYYDVRGVFHEDDQAPTIPDLRPLAVIEAEIGAQKAIEAEKARAEEEAAAKKASDAIKAAAAANAKTAEPPKPPAEVKK